MYTKENYAGRKEISDAMASYWAQFAYSGEPGRGRDGKLPEWKAWDNKADANKFILLDTTKGGGIRMSSATVSDEALKKRLLADQAAIGDQKHLCALYARLFRYTFNADYEAWREDEYKNFGAQGCASYPSASFEQAE
jgi:para-nitrobenzyl esterase